MKACIAIIGIVFLQLIFNICSAQDITLNFTLVEGNHGKPLRKITAITQDLNGYMWFAGQDAQCLYRYDGNRVTAYSHDSTNPNSLGGTNLETIYADDKGFIWIGFGNEGLDRFDPATGMFKHYRHSPDDPGTISGRGVSCILKDSKGRLWVGSKGLEMLDLKTGKFVHFVHDSSNPRSLSSDVVNTIYEDRSGTIWVGTGFSWFNQYPENGGLNKLDPDGSFTRYLHDPADPNSLINNKVRSIFEDSRGIFWVGTNSDGLHTMDRASGRFTRHRHNPARPSQLSRPPLTKEDMNDPITFICEDKTGAIWIATRTGGINRYDTLTKKITNYKNRNGFPDGSGWNAFSSRDGVLWISTEEGNLYKVDPLRKKIPSNKGVMLNQLLEDKNGMLWAATDGRGIWQYDRNKQLIHQYINVPASPGSLFFDDVWCLFSSGGDSIWIGTFKGLGVFNMKTKQFSRVSFDSSIKDDDINPITSIFQDKSGVIWLTRLAGPSLYSLLKYNPGDRTFQKYAHDPKDPSSVGSTALNRGLEDASGNIWVGGNLLLGIMGGISRLNRNTGKFTRYLDAFNVRTIYEDHSGIIWAGTDKGLYRYDKKAGEFLNIFDAQSELSEAGIHGIVEDGQGNIWVSTNIVILKINQKKNQTIYYGRKSGIIPNFLSGPVFLKRDGELLIGNKEGFYSFYPDQLDFNIPPSTLVVTAIEVNTTPLSRLKLKKEMKPVEEITDLQFTYNQNNLSFSFAVTDYRAPETNKYFTRLEGYDSVWHESGAEKIAYYYNVSPGNYTFQIKAFDSDGLQLLKMIAVHISPPWWKTWWAYVMYVLTVLAAGFIAFRTIKQRIILREQQKSQEFELAQAKKIEKAYKELKATQIQLIQAEKMASLGELTAGIAHEIQNPLNFVNNFAEINTELIEEAEQAIDKGDQAEAKLILSDLKDNEKKIRHHGQRADAIVKNMLQHSRSSAGQKEPTDINALADEYFRLAYHGLRAKDKSFNANLNTDFDTNIGKINIIPQDIGRVLLNLYNNAFFAVEDRKKTAGMEYEPRVTVSTKLIFESANPLLPPDAAQSATRLRQSTSAGTSANSVIISVKDNGNGIPPNLVEKVFQPFFTTKPTGQGTGLGLSLSYDIIKAHGGEIKVQTKEGEFAEFVIQLPV